MSTVSVIIPAYNQGHYLVQAIESVLSQRYRDLEVIVVDDGSTDDTAEVANSFSDPRISYFYQENRGLSAARNTGIRLASGRFITYLDSDDLFLPKKVELLVDKLEQEPDLGFVAGQAIPIDERGNRVGMKFDKCISEEGHHLLLGNPYHVGSVMLLSSWQRKVGYFDESLRSYEDWDMWLRLVRAGCVFGWVDQPVSLYRFHTDQMTRIGNQMTKATFAVLDKYFSDPNLPPDWMELRDLAYSNAHLRGAAQAYRARDFHSAQEHLISAVNLNPDLVADNADLLAREFAKWITLPKTSDPLVFLEDIYANLPSSLSLVWKRRRKDLGRAAMELSFDNYDKRDLQKTKRYVRKAMMYQPGWMTNRGALSILVRSHIPFLNHP